MELENLVFGNPVISSNIFSHLDFSTLKFVRLVDVFWNKIGTERLKSLNFKLQLILSEDLQVFSEKMHLLQKFGIQNIIIADGVCCQLPTYSKKWIAVEDILTEIGPQFKSVEINYSCIQDANIISLFKTVLRQCNSAIEFRIGIDYSGDNVEIDESYKNYSIRKVRISKPSILPKRFRNLIQLFPNMEEIELTSAYTIYKFLSDSYHLQQLDKVKSLKLYNQTETNRNAAKFSDSDIKFSPKLPSLVRLEVVDLHINVYGNDEEYSLKFCNSFKENLESLKFGCILHNRTELKFPTMPKLQSLSLKFEIEGEESRNIVVLVGHGLITEKFPNLKNLRIELGINFPTQQFISDNFGSLQNEVVRKLDFKFPSEQDKELFCVLATQNLLESFPNAELKFDHNLVLASF